MKKRWEYRFAFVGSKVEHLTETVLNDFGSEGWEFTGYVKDGETGKHYLMKRKVKS